MDSPEIRPTLPCPYDKLYPSQLVRDDVFFMKLAYNQAIDAWRADETPIGAVVELNGEPIASAHNRVDTTRDPTAHAEMLAITKAANFIGDWRLNECRLYVTKEPCPMCAGASIMARFKEVIFAIPDPKMGYLGGAIEAHSTPTLNHSLQVRSGVLEAECLELIQAYFRLKRIQAKNSQPDIEGPNPAIGS
ncbi:MAG: nucleoside deaminase [Verrucomicrobiota bacterium]